MEATGGAARAALIMVWGVVLQAITPDLVTTLTIATATLALVATLTIAAVTKAHEGTTLTIVARSTTALADVTTSQVGGPTTGRHLITGWPPHPRHQRTSVGSCIPTPSSMCTLSMTRKTRK